MKLAKIEALTNFNLEKEGVHPSSAIHISKSVYLGENTSYDAIKSYIVSLPSLYQGKYILFDLLVHYAPLVRVTGFIYSNALYGAFISIGHDRFTFSRLLDGIWQDDKTI